MYYMYIHVHVYTCSTCIRVHVLTRVGLPLGRGPAVYRNDTTGTLIYTCTNKLYVRIIIHDCTHVDISLKNIMQVLLLNLDFIWIFIKHWTCT